MANPVAVDIQSVSDETMSRINPLKDATNILKALFRKHDVSSLNRKEKENEKFENEEWS